MGRIERIISYFFVVLFAGYYASMAFFPHSHIIGGTVVAHSHIHADSHHDTNNGNHTEQSIALIAQIAHFEYIDFSCNCILKPTQLPLYEDKFVETTHWVVSIYLKNLSLRAPPVLA